MLAASSCPGSWCFSQSGELIPYLIDRNALQVPVESAESVFSRQSVIPKGIRPRHQSDLQPWHESPFLLYKERSEVQRDKGFSNSLQHRLPLSFGGKVGMLFSSWGFFLWVLCLGGFF